MTNPYYNHSGYPSQRAPGASSSLRTELSNITLAFSKLPALSGNALKYVRVNAAETGLEAVALDTSLLPTSGGTITGALSVVGLTTLGRFMAGVGDADANSIAGDDQHWANITNDPALTAGLHGSGLQLLRINSYGNSGYGGNFHFCRYYGSIAAPAAIQNGAFLMSFGMRGHDGTGLSQSAGAYQFIATENWNAAGHGGKFRWEVTPNGSILRALGMELDSSGLTVTGKVVSTSKAGSWAELPFAASDESTALTTGADKISLRSTCAMTLTEVRASLRTAQTSGAALTVNVKVNGVSIFSTKLTFDNTEKTTVTAAVPCVLSTTSIPDDAEITVDIDQVGDGTAKGLKVYLIGKRA